MVKLNYVPARDLETPTENPFRSLTPRLGNHILTLL